ncbi:Mucin-5AC like [Actinidia chinensis var. chinensis]|uniref:Mucin-5AC like n=1 Tax=Actinidia chinensis var. chinensis TaxID=1590841 RepID=A0A2R6S1H2_ACTCC|nr:Mucin-5AC like [Actinidia chinensis var. chinensis]
MATGAAGDRLFRGCVFDGCLSGSDTEIKQRPYHRNCSCALHRSRGLCPHASPRCAHVSYPIRRTWSEGSLALLASSDVHDSPCSSPALIATPIPRTRTYAQFTLSNDE